MYTLAASLLLATLTVTSAAPSGWWPGAALAGPVFGPSVLEGPVTGPARISGAVDKGAIVTGSVAAPSIVSGSVVGGTAVVEPSYGLGLPYGYPGWGPGPAAYGVHGPVLKGPVAPHAAIVAPVLAPSVIAGPSGTIHAGLGVPGGILRGYDRHY